MARKLFQEGLSISQKVNTSSLKYGPENVYFLEERLLKKETANRLFFRTLSSTNRTSCKHKTSQQGSNDAGESVHLNTTSKRLHANAAVDPFSLMTTSMIRNKEKYILIHKPEIDERSLDYRLKPPGTHCDSGAVKKRPKANKTKLISVAVIVGSFMYFGGQISSYAANLLDKYEIFALPEDED